MKPSGTATTSATATAHPPTSDQWKTTNTTPREMVQRMISQIASQMTVPMAGDAEMAGWSTKPGGWYLA